MRAADRPLLKEEKVPGVVPVGRFGSTARALKRPVSTACATAVDTGR